MEAKDTPPDKAAQKVSRVLVSIYEDILHTLGTFMKSYRALYDSQLISTQLKMEKSKNGMWTSPMKKFRRLH